MILLDTLLIGGIRFVLGRVAAAVDAELSDDSLWREELLAAQMRLELGELSEAEYVELERELLARINEVRDRTRGPLEAGARYSVSEVETTFDDRAPGT